jgi:hypothetical protein
MPYDSVNCTPNVVYADFFAPGEYAQKSIQVSIDYRYIFMTIQPVSDSLYASCVPSVPVSVSVSMHPLAVPASMFLYLCS